MQDHADRMQEPGACIPMGSADSWAEASRPSCIWAARSCISAARPRSAVPPDQAAEFEGSLVARRASSQRATRRSRHPNGPSSGRAARILSSLNGCDGRIPTG
jgi:hypothetical protein